MLPRRSLLVGAFIFIFSLKALASVEVGVGMSSAMSGRYIPGATAAYLGDNWALSGTTIGTQTSVDYMSAYTLAVDRTWKAGEFWWGDVTFGFGGGVGYEERGYRSSPTSSFDRNSEFLFGPHLRGTWDIAGPFVLSFDALFGFGTATANVPPLFRDLVMFSLGCQL